MFSDVGVFVYYGVILKSLLRFVGSLGDVIIFFIILVYENKIDIYE